MAILLRDGRRVCGKQCHTAQGEKCRCLCGGRYHGSEVKREQLELFKGEADAEPTRD